MGACLGLLSGFKPPREQLGTKLTSIAWAALERLSAPGCHSLSYPYPNFLRVGIFKMNSAEWLKSGNEMLGQVRASFMVLGAIGYLSHTSWDLVFFCASTHSLCLAEAYSRGPHFIGMAFLYYPLVKKSLVSPCT